VELMTSPSDHPHLRALGREIERTARRVGQLEELLASLAADVAGLSRHLGAAAPGSGDAPPASSGSGEQRPDGGRAWLLADNPVHALAMLTDLIDWLDRVYLAYSDAALPSCWLWHPDVVEELWWLRCAHVEAYHPQAGNWLRAGDWHDRQRPNLVRRIRTAIGTCELSEHHPGRPASYPTPNTPLAGAVGLIADWVAAGRPAPAPAPTAGHLAEAEEQHRSDLDRARSRSRR
jgi:hypothetical protein